MIDARTPTASSLPRRSVVITCLLIAATLTACSSSKSTSRPSPPASTKPVTTATPSLSRASSADLAAITSAYTKFFDSKTSVPASMVLLQDGPAFKAALEQQAKTSQAQKSSVTVSKLTLRSPNSAVVTFTILISGNPVIKNTQGFAIRENGTWKVAGATFCGLLTLNGGVPAACSAPAATSLPN